MFMYLIRKAGLVLECIEAFLAVFAQSHKLSQRIHSLIVAEINLSGKTVCQVVNTVKQYYTQQPAVHWQQSLKSLLKCCVLLTFINFQWLHSSIILAFQIKYMNIYSSAIH